MKNKNFTEKEVGQLEDVYFEIGARLSAGVISLDEAKAEYQEAEMAILGGIVVAYRVKNDSAETEVDYGEAFDKISCLGDKKDEDGDLGI